MSPKVAIKKIIENIELLKEVSLVDAYCKVKAGIRYCS